MIKTRSLSDDFDKFFSTADANKLRFKYLSNHRFYHIESKKEGFAGAVPFAGNIEFFVYMKKNGIWKLNTFRNYIEIIIYSILFVLLAGWFLF